MRVDAELPSNFSELGAWRHAAFTMGGEQCAAMNETLPQFRTAPNGRQYRLVNHVFDPLRGRVLVVVEAVERQRTWVMPVARWNAMAAIEPREPREPLGV